MRTFSYQFFFDNRNRIGMGSFQTANDRPVDKAFLEEPQSELRIQYTKPIRITSVSLTSHHGKSFLVVYADSMNLLKRQLIIQML